jgi:replicative DNA helicase
MQQQQETFDKYGRDFKNKVLEACVLDYKYFQEIYPICKPTYFGSGSHSILFKVIYDYYEKYHTLPSFDSLDIEIGNIGSQEVKDTCTTIVSEMRKGTTIIELQHVKDSSSEFCQEKEMEQAILDSVGYINDGKVDAIKPRVEQALKHIHVVDTGHEYFDKLDDRLHENMRNAVPTGFPLLDANDILEGGLAGGEIGVVIAPTGGGKSYWLTSIGKGALAAGMNVVHYTFELSEINIGKRYDAAITSFPIKMLRDNQKEVRQALKDFNGGKLIIKEFPTRSANINKLKFHIDRLSAQNFKPDVIIVDYADLMRSTRSYEQRTHELEAIYEELRGYSMETKIPVWTASQTNRSGLEEDIIGLDKIADAYAKAQVADFIITFSRNKVEKLNNGGKLYIAKNRIGFDGKVYQVMFDPSTAQIEVREGLDEDYDSSVELKSGVAEMFKTFKDRKGLDLEGVDQLLV